MDYRLFEWYKDNGIGEMDGEKYCPVDYNMPGNIRIKARNAPINGDLKIDIKADGVSIFESETRAIQESEETEDTLEYYTLSAAFTVGETITGGTSSNTAVIQRDNQIGTAYLTSVSGPFTVGETVTGGTSASTAVVAAHVRQSIKLYDKAPKTTQYGATLPEGQTVMVSGIGESFKKNVQIVADSWLTCEILESNGASGISVCLEMMVFDEDYQIEDRNDE